MIGRSREVCKTSAKQILKIQLSNTVTLLSKVNQDLVVKDLQWMVAAKDFGNSVVVKDNSNRNKAWWIKEDTPRV